MKHDCIIVFRENRLKLEKEPVLSRTLKLSSKLKNFIGKIYLSKVFAISFDACRKLLED